MSKPVIEPTPEELFVERLAKSWRATDKQAAERIEELQRENKLLQRTLAAAILASGGEMRVPDWMVQQLDERTTIQQSHLYDEGITVLTARLETS